MAYIEAYAKHQTPIKSQPNKPTIKVGKLVLSSTGVHFDGRIFPWECWDKLNNQDFIVLSHLTPKQVDHIASYRKQYISSESVLIYFDFNPQTNEFTSKYLTGNQANFALRKAMDRAIKNNTVLMNQMQTDYPYLWFYRVDNAVNLRRNNR